MPGEILDLPSAASSRAVRSQVDALGPWFYRFRFSNGAETSGPDARTEAVHETRARMILPWLDRLIGQDWSEVECIDLACHQGWFASQLALRGSKRVLGIDIRPEHLEMAEVIREVGGLTNLEFQQGDLANLASENLGSFDLVLFLGVLYHLDEPMRTLRLVRRLTRSICVLETQVARAAAPLDCLWGSGAPRSGAGIAVVTADRQHSGTELPLVLVPTLDALLSMMYAVGFGSVLVATAAPDDFDQFRSGDRVVLFAAP